jgi:hypothetical protein
MKAPFLKNICIAICLLSTLSNSFGQTSLLSKNSKISILTCDTGNESYSLFGHTAIRVTDVENNLDIVYNYGAFDFRTPNFVPKFAKGDLDYYIVNDRYIDFINQYNYEKRSVYEQELNISLEEKQKIFDNLAQSLLSDERLYQYKFIDNNCTTKVVDLINKNLGTNIIQKKVDTNKTYRAILYPYFDNHFYEKLGTSLIFGTKVDQMGSKLFLPFELLESLKKTEYRKQQFAKDPVTLLSFEKETKTSWWNSIYSYLLLLGLIAFINLKSIRFIYLFSIASIGLLFAFLGFYSFHHELEYNFNILVLNPLLFVLLYFWITKNAKWTYNLCLVNILSTVIYFFIILTKPYLLIVLPLILTNLLVLFKMAKANQKRIPIIV